MPVETARSSQTFVSICYHNVKSPWTFWFPVENREEPIKSLLSVCLFVCLCVCLCVTDYLRNCSEDFSETWHEVGGKKCKKRSTAAFLRFLPVFSKTAHLCAKKALFYNF